MTGLRSVARAGGLGLVAMLLVYLTPRPMEGHDVEVTSVARVFIEEIGAGRYALSLLDAELPPRSDPAAMLPSACRPLPNGSAEIRAGAGFAFACDRPLGVEDVVILPLNLAGVVVVYRQMDGEDASAYFRSEGAGVPVRIADLGPAAGSAARLAVRYLTLGVEHILFGIDHLLFVLGLLLLVHGTRPLVATITAFTVAHSLTLGAAVFGLVPVSPGPVEATIALSIVLLAREIAMEQRGRVDLVHRRPWLVAFAFGLLHGFGFAGALGEIGLRSADVPLALLFFNLGVEVGQLTFVAFLILVYWRVRGALAHRLPRTKLALSYALGTVATLWFFARLPGVWGS